uniref:Nudix hydrolase domain-containing protein n=1 Tax=Panagrolaimus davidi TaxID=227884 RepID=A0A914Q6W6_9BILA
MSLKIAATTILRNEAREVLMLKRGATAKFMPNSLVFPGGIVEPKIDASFPESKTNYEEKNYDGILLNGFKNDFPLRVGAARELFEEAGVLLVFDVNIRVCQALTPEHDKSLNEWRKKVREDPSKFSQLFGSSLKLDVDALIPWSNWLTPASYNRRFDTVFFVVPITETITEEFCEREMAGAKWDIPSHFIERNDGEERLSLPPPQFYELARLRLMHCNERESLEKMSNPFKICPQVVLNSDTPGIRTTLMPGDFCFDWSKRFEGTPLKTLTTKELTPTENVSIHRITFSENPLYSQINLEIKNVDRLSNKIHLFHCQETFTEDRQRILDEILNEPKRRNKHEK